MTVVDITLDGSRVEVLEVLYAEARTEGGPVFPAGTDDGDRAYIVRAGPDDVGFVVATDVDGHTAAAIVWVRPSRRGVGLGAAALDALAATEQARGTAQLEAVTGVSNTAANAALRAAGFTDVGDDGADRTWTRAL